MVWRRGFILLVSIVLSAAVAAAAGATRSDGIQPNEYSLEEYVSAPEVAGLAEAMDMSLDQAAEMLELQGELDAFIEPLSRAPEFVDYRGPFAEEGALLIVEPGAENLFSDLPQGLAVRPAELNRGDRAVAQDEAETLARVAADSAYRDVSYDPFDNSYTVWVVAGSRTTALASRLESDLAHLETNPGAGVNVEETQMASAKGGQKMSVTGQGFCTSGFGINTFMGGAYLTAGHCGIHTFVINGNTSTFVLGRTVGDYKDREAVIAGGSSKYVQVTPRGTNGVDMENSVGHIYLDNWYNSFGQGSMLNVGGIILNVNVRSQFGTWVSESEATGCASGDSGGPVYYYRPSDGKRFPKGLIAAVDVVNGHCGYVALDDQLVGTGWTLK